MCSIGNKFWTISELNALCKFKGNKFYTIMERQHMQILAGQPTVALCKLLLGVPTNVSVAVYIESMSSFKAQTMVSLLVVAFNFLVGCTYIFIH